MPKLDKNTGQVLQEHLPTLRESVNNTVFEAYKSDEVCQILRISISTLKRFRINGTLTPNFYVGKSPRYTRQNIENYIQNNSIS